jgi:GNAT superfamily N-acetyltransferase
MTAGLKPSLVLRDLVPADYERVCELRNFTLTEPLTPAIFRLREETWKPEWIWKRWVAVEGEEIVAYAQILQLEGFAPGAYYFNIDVDPARHRAGIGSQLLESIEQDVASRGGGVIVVPARDDRPGPIAFLTKRGFGVHQHLFEGLLDTRQIDEESIQNRVSQVEQSGLRIVNYRDLGDSSENRRRLHALHNQTDKDSPGAEFWGDTAFENFELECFLTERYDPDAIFLALDGDEWISLSMVCKVSADEYGTVFTGTLPRYRGRGLGLALKGLAVSYAKSQGAKFVRAQNDTRNEPMLSINSLLGFKPQFGWIHMSKRIQGDEHGN